MPRAPTGPRPISNAEIEVLEKALVACAVAPVDRAVIASIPSLVVVRNCECGCDTVEFLGIDWSEPPSVLADGEGLTHDGHAVGLIVFGQSGGITCLEVYCFDNATPRLPTPDTIRPLDDH